MYVSLRALVLATTLFASGGASAQNLLENGTFDSVSQIAGWAFGGNSDMHWSAIDADDSPSSGSGFVQNTGVGGSLEGAGQCFVAEPDTVYQLRGSAMIPADEDGQATALIDVYWSDTSFCQNPLHFDNVLPLSVVGSWMRGETEVTSPPGTTHAQMSLRVYKIGSPPLPPGAYFDDLYVPEPASPQLDCAAAGALVLIAIRGGRSRFLPARPSHAHRGSRKPTCTS